MDRTRSDRYGDITTPEHTRLSLLSTAKIGTELTRHDKSYIALLEIEK